MSFFLAAASSDGQNIDRHFGHSDSFSIVRAEDDGSYELQERRSVDSPCQHGFHEEGAMLRAVEALTDCRYVLAEAVGHGAAAQLIARGITPLEIDGPLSEAVSQVIVYEKRQHRNVQKA